MRLQHMLALADGYSNGYDYHGTTDLVFRRAVEGGHIFIQINMVEEAPGWLIMVDVEHPGHERYVDKVRCDKLNLGLNQIMKALPPWCKV